jgi:hypothetical protein
MAPAARVLAQGGGDGLELLGALAGLGDADLAGEAGLDLGGAVADIAGVTLAIDPVLHGREFFEAVTYGACGDEGEGGDELGEAHADWISN